MEPTVTPYHSTDTQDEKFEDGFSYSLESFPHKSMELKSLLESNQGTKATQHSRPAWLLISLFISNILLLTLAIILGTKLYHAKECVDPSLGVWCKLIIISIKVTLLM